YPSILVVHEFGERDGVFFLITEFVDGVNLRQLMELGELSAAEALRIAPQICTALQYAHEHGVVHRDIKPENILIDARGQVKIADFGLAKVAAYADDPVELTRRTAVLGTPHYMAPEQWRGKSAGVDHRADIYSLGVVLYEMLTGQLPIGHFDLPSQREGVPRGLDQVVQRALAQQPENRYQNAGEVRDDVEEQAQRLRGGARAGGAAAPAALAAGGGAALRRDPRRLVWGPRLAVAVVLLGLLAIGSWMYATHQWQIARNSFRSELIQYDGSGKRALAEIQSGVQGVQKAGGGALPDSPRERPPVSIEAARNMAVAFAAGAGMLILMLGWRSLREVRRRPHELRGLAAAVITAWVVPLALVSGLLFQSVSGPRAHPSVATLFALVLFVAMICFLIREVRRHRTAIEAGRPECIGRVWTSLAGGLSMLLFAAVPLVPLALPLEPWAYEWNRGPTWSQDLLGCSTEQVLQRLGPPVDVMVATDSRRWEYQVAGSDAPGVLQLSGNEVMAFDVPDQLLLPHDAPRPWVGASVQEFVEAYGPPTDTAVGRTGTVITFGNGVRAMVRNGVVLSRSDG
ncbi:MAG: protein kinase, partial [Planctomycetota bacterium]